MSLEKILKNVKTAAKALLFAGSMAVAGCGFHFERGPPTYFLKADTKPVIEKEKKEENIPPPRGKIFFIEDENNQTAKLMSVDAADGSKLKTVYNNTIWRMAVSPKSSYVLFKEADERKKINGEWKKTKRGKYKIIDLEGRVKKSFRKWFGQFSNRDFVWTPDERRILFSKYAQQQINWCYILTSIKHTLCKCTIKHAFKCHCFPRSAFTFYFNLF